jgi:DNA-binding transcriptional ArsR family regulator
MAQPDALEALGDGTRRAVFEELRAGPLNVAALARTMPVSRPAVSQHLKILREAGLVTVRREGRTAIYSIDPRGLVELRAYLETFWDGVLDAFSEAVRKEHYPRKKGRKS